MARLLRRLLGLSLFGKVLIANSAIVALGAIAGTYLTTQRVLASPQGTHYEMMALFGATGLVLSIVVNAIILRTALLPLTQLERTARRVTTGDLEARVRLGLLRDPHTAQLADTFNTMLESLQAHTRRLEEYSVRLQELSDKVLIAQEEERRRLSRELHDETGQELSTLLLGLKLFRDATAQSDLDVAALRAQAAELSELARGTLDGVRRLALELRPRMLDDLGLATALRAYVDEWSARTQVPVTYSASLEDAPSLPPSTEIAVYRMVQEALVNVAKHAAASRVAVTLAVEGDALVAEVQDNGRGMETSAYMGEDVGTSKGADEGTGVGTGTKLSAGADSSPAGGLSAGVGLFGTQERISLVGGRFSVEPTPGGGTTLRAVIPLSAQERPAP